MSEEQGKENGAEVEDDIYTEPKSRPKIIRILTVFAYISSVSMAAILLSVYYIFMWDGQPTLARRRDPHMEPMVDYSLSFYQDDHKLYPNINNKATDSSFENVLNNNYSLSSLKMVIEETSKNESVSETNTMKKYNFPTLNSTDSTTPEQIIDRGNLKIAPKQTQEELAKPTIDLSFETSSPDPRKDIEVETIEEDIDASSLSGSEQTNNRILSNNKFFFKKLILP